MSGELVAAKQRTENREVKRRRVIAASSMVLSLLGIVAIRHSSDVDPSQHTSQVESNAMFRNDVEYQDYPAWTKSVNDVNAQNHINHGKWTSIEGPPFLQRITLYSGNGVDITHGGNIVRKVVGIPKNFGKWEGNRFLANFESQQMRFFQSNKNSALVIPPLSQGNLPILSDYAKGMLKHYVALGHNTLIVCGGPASVEFINQNLYTSSEGTLLFQPAWTRGPYEKQEVCDGTPFQSLPVTLPTMKGHVHGVRTQSLPQDATSYYETGEGSPGGGVSVIFSLKMAEGQLIYVGFDYSTASEPWIRALAAALEFAS